MSMTLSRNQPHICEYQVIDSCCINQLVDLWYPFSHCFTHVCASSPSLGSSYHAVQYLSNPSGVQTSSASGKSSGFIGLVSTKGLPRTHPQTPIRRNWLPLLCYLDLYRYHLCFPHLGLQTIFRLIYWLLHHGWITQRHYFQIHFAHISMCPHILQYDNPFHFILQHKSYNINPSITM